MNPLKLCIECSTRHREPGPRCRTHELAHQKARNAARRHLYGGTWAATSRRARKAVGSCALCGARRDLTLDHEHGQVECRSCNSKHRRNPS